MFQKPRLIASLKAKSVLLHSSKLGSVSLSYPCRWSFASPVFCHIFDIILLISYIRLHTSAFIHPPSSIIHQPSSIIHQPSNIILNSVLGFCVFCQIICGMDGDGTKSRRWFCVGMEAGYCQACLSKRPHSAQRNCKAVPSPSIKIRGIYQICVTIFQRTKRGRGWSDCVHERYVM